MYAIREAERYEGGWIIGLLPSLDEAIKALRIIYAERSADERYIVERWDGGKSFGVERVRSSYAEAFESPDDDPFWTQYYIVDFEVHGTADEWANVWKR